MGRRHMATVLVGPSALLREGLAGILRDTDFRIEQSVTSVDELRTESLARHASLLLIIEYHHSVCATVAEIERFKLRHASRRIAVLACSPLSEDLISLVEAGANAFLAKSMSREALVRTLDLVSLGETVLPRELVANRGTAGPKQQYRPAHQRDDMAEEPDPVWNGLPRLSGRERSILHCLIQGASNKIIARRFGIAESTVKVHVKAILRKIRAHNRTQAAIWAMNNNISVVAPEFKLLPHAPQLPSENSGSGNSGDTGNCGDGVKPAVVPQDLAPAPNGAAP